MEFILDFDTADKVQAVNIKTDVEVQHSIVCPFAVTWDSGPSFASYNAGTKEVVLSAAMITYSFVGVNPITLKVTSPTYPSDVPVATYTFDANVIFCVT